MTSEAAAVSVTAANPKPHILVAATGSVATIKLPQILNALSELPVEIRVILTPNARNFLAGQSAEQPPLESLASVAEVYQDADEWNPPWTRGAPILHIELRRWADLILVAPMSANSLAAMVNGFADGLVASVLRAWDTSGEIDGIRKGVYAKSYVGRIKPALIAPAMNTAMYRHPITKRHMDVLRNEWNISSGGWIEVLEPTQKELACGDVGDGAMMEWKDIVKHVGAWLRV